MNNGQKVNNPKRNFCFFAYGDRKSLKDCGYSRLIYLPFGKVINVYNIDMQRNNMHSLKACKKWEQADKDGDRCKGQKETLRTQKTGEIL